MDYEVMVLLEQMQNQGEEGNTEEAIKILHSVQFLLERKKHVEVVLLILCTLLEDITRHIAGTQTS